MIDAIQIFPDLTPNGDNHPATCDSGKIHKSKHKEPSNDLASVGTLVNGLQTTKDWWYATTAQYNSQTLVLIVDFSSLPYDRCPISDVRAILVRDRQEVEKSKIKNQWTYENIGSDLFYIKFVDALKEDVIKLTFTVDVELIEASLDPTKITRKVRVETAE